MTLKREIFLKTIIDNCVFLEKEIALKASSNLNDLPVIAEDFIKGLFNIVFDLNLENLNSSNFNYPGIDLGDKKNKVAVQVTCTTSTKKIQDTIDSFIKYELHKNYNCLYIFTLKSKCKNYSKLNTSEYFLFDPQKHILDFTTLYKFKILNLPTKKLKEISDFCNQEIQYLSESGLDELRKQKLTQIENLSFYGIHMSLGGQHQGWGGTDKISVNLRNEGFAPVQLIRCFVQWKTICEKSINQLNPEHQLCLPKLLNPGCIVQIKFQLTPQDIQNSKINTSKYLNAPGNEWMASSILYRVFAEIRTETGQKLSGLIIYFFPHDQHKTLTVTLK